MSAGEQGTSWGRGAGPVMLDEQVLTQAVRLARAPASVAVAGGEAGKGRLEWLWEGPRLRAVGSWPRTSGSSLGASPHIKYDH